MEPATPLAQQPRPASLGDSINIATRSVHTRLNKLILLRLPLALPPNTPSPSAYVTGLLHVAPIYITFESLWDVLLQERPPAAALSDADPCDPENQHPPETARPILCERMRTILSQLHFPALQRATQIRRDIQGLTGWSEAAVEEQLQALTGLGNDGSQLDGFVTHIRRTVETSPHVLLAYSWVLYMALFSGGRFIRAALEAAGERFWSVQAEAVPQQQQQPSAMAIPSEDISSSERSGSCHVDFFRFDAPEDGSLLKKEFKARFLEIEGLLTAGERDAIVREALCIFNNMILLVAQLDAVCETRPSDVARSKDSTTLSEESSLLPSPPARVGSGRFRDSILVTRERKSLQEGAKRQPSRGADSTLGGVTEQARVELGSDREADENQSNSSTTDSSDVPSSDDAGDDGVEYDKPAAEQACCLPALKSVRFDPAALPLPSKAPTATRRCPGSQSKGELDMLCPGPQSLLGRTEKPRQSVAHFLYQYVRPNTMLLATVAVSLAGLWYGRSWV